MIVLLCLTQVFLYMPNNAQGAIIISGIITLFDYKCAAAPAAACCHCFLFHLVSAAQ
jgi:hypothetical protein